MVKVLALCLVVFVGNLQRLWAECFDTKVKSILIDHCTCISSPNEVTQVHCEMRVLINTAAQYPYNEFDLLFLHLSISSDYNNPACLNMEALTIKKTNSDALVTSNATTLTMNPLAAFLLSVLVEEELDVVFTQPLPFGKLVHSASQCAVSAKNFLPGIEIVNNPDAIASIVEDIRHLLKDAVVVKAAVTFAETVKSLPAPYSEHLRGANIKVLVIQHSSIEALNWNSFPELVSLSRLEISNCQITRVAKGALRNVPEVKSLSFARNKLDYIPEDIFILASLEELDLSGNSPRGVFRLRSGNKDLRSQAESFALNDTRIVSLPSRAFRNFPNLRKLFLSGCSISDIHALAFDSLRFLEILDLSQNKISSVAGSTSGSISYHSVFLPLEHLISLNLSFNSISKLFPGDFDHVSASEVDLRGNEVEMWVPEAFKNMKRLQSLNLSNNRFVALENISHPLDLNVTVNFSNNPLHCSCPPLPIFETDFLIASCSTPLSFQGKDVGDFLRAECSGQAAAFENVTLFCFIHALLFLFIRNLA